MRYALALLILLFSAVVVAACDSPFCMPYGDQSCPGSGAGTGGAAPECAAMVRTTGDATVFVCNVPSRFQDLYALVPAGTPECGLLACAFNLGEAEDRMSDAMAAQGAAVDASGPTLTCKGFSTWNQAADDYQPSDCVKTMPAPCGEFGDDCTYGDDPGPKCCPDLVCGAGSEDEGGICCLEEGSPCDPDNPQCCPEDGDGDPPDVCAPSNASTEPVCCLTAGAPCGDGLFFDSSGCCYGLYCAAVEGVTAYGTCQ